MVNIPIHRKGPGGSMSQLVGLPNNSYKPITNTAWVRARTCKLQKGCTRLAAASDKVYQLLAHGRWFSPASSTAKIGRHDITEILLKMVLNDKNQSINQPYAQINLTNFGFPVLTLSCTCSQKHIHYLSFQSLDVPDDGYSRNMSCALNYRCISTFYYYHQVDTSTVGVVVVPESNICQIFSVFGNDMVYQINKCYRIPKVQSQMDIPEKLATQGKQDEEKQRKTQHYAQTNTNDAHKTMRPPTNNWR